MSSCILYQDSSSTLVVVDIPRSIELAQGSSISKRLLSSKPIDAPFPSQEPKSSKARENLGSHTVQDLILQKHLSLALSTIKDQYSGEWCLPRALHEEKQDADPSSRKKRGIENDGAKEKQDQECATTDEPIPRGSSSLVDSVRPGQIYLHNPEPFPVFVEDGLRSATILVPPQSTAIQGEIEATRSDLTQQAPSFDLIVMDPPWPNRSARRKAGYDISYNLKEISTLLRSVPIEDRLSKEGYVGIWITNKPAFRELVSDLFGEWGVTLVEEWIWLKVTSRGEPISTLDSLWRKPYEILLVARKGAVPQDLERRVLVAVPDLHSRKPNLKTLFEQKLFKKQEHQALEVFARNMTKGWWAWGNEVLKFQAEEYWVDADDAEIAKE